jgi:hypothetical protein
LALSFSNIPRKTKPIFIYERGTAHTTVNMSCISFINFSLV